MNPYVEILLGQEAIAYIRSCLEHGKTLSRLILEGVQLDAGRVATWLPAAVSRESAHDFEAGGKLPAPDPSSWLQVPGGYAVPVPGTQDHLARWIQAFLRQGGDRLCIFENFNASPGDPFLQDLGSRVVTFSDEVYHLLLPQDGELGKIAETIDDSFSLPVFVGATSSLPEAGADRLTQGDLETLAGRLENLIVGAYDGEGFLIWSPEPNGAT